MSNEAAKATETPKTAKPPTAGDPARTAIPVKELRFSQHVVMPMPGTHGGHDHRVHALIAGTSNGRDVTIDIEYRPWMRHHRVTWQRGEQQGVFYVHESVATWVPASE